MGILARTSVLWLLAESTCYQFLAVSAGAVFQQDERSSPVIFIVHEMHYTDKIFKFDLQQQPQMTLELHGTQRILKLNVEHCKVGYEAPKGYPAWVIIYKLFLSIWPLVPSPDLWHLHQNDYPSWTQCGTYTCYLRNPSKFHFSKYHVNEISQVDFRWP